LPPPPRRLVAARFAAAIPSPLPSPLSTAYDCDDDAAPLAHAAAPAGASAADASMPEEAAAMHARALALARAEAYPQARVAFERLLRRYPSLCTAWTSYAQMEKRAALRSGGGGGGVAAGEGGDAGEDGAVGGIGGVGGNNNGGDRFAACRAVLQRALALNPTSACLVQAWGLMELQKNNAWAAVRLLERGAALDPRRNAAVLRWVPVKHAASVAASASSSGGGTGGGVTRAAAAAAAGPRAASGGGRGAAAA
jgi:tetratricopeptide (TPR) repeat protein